MDSFIEIYKKITESNISGDGGVFGNSNYINNANGTYINYAGDDVRIPKIIGKNNKKKKKIKILKRI